MTSKSIFRLFAAVIGTVGIALQLYFYGLNMLLYYTIISNSLVTCYFYYFSSKTENIVNSPRMQFFKSGVLLSILLTGLVYHFMLAPLATADQYYNVQNFIVHYIMPGLMVLDWLLLDKRATLQWFAPIIWTVFPLLYSMFAIFNGLVIKLPIPNNPDSPFPYFFLNISKYGISGVFANSIGLFIGYILLGYIVIGINALLMRLNLKKR